MLEVGKDVTWIIHYDEVHPWTQDPGWDTMEIFARTEEHLTKAIDLAVSEGWLLYIRDTTGLIGAFLYRAMKKVKWKFHILFKIKCWYAYGFAFEIEYSPKFHGIYFKLAHTEVHVGTWSNSAYKNYLEEAV